MPIITANVTDVTGVGDDTTWVFASVLREGNDGAIITTHKVPVLPVDGMLSVELDEGFAIVSFGGRSYTITVPATDSDLWDLIAAAVAFPPDTSAAALAAAIDAYLAAHGGGGSGGPAATWDTLSGKPVVVAAAATAALARAVIDAATTESVSAVATSVAAKYSKPSTGIPGTDLATAVQASLAKANSALQVAPTPLVASVTVATGGEVRPDAGLVLWIGGSTQPTNMVTGDVWLELV